MLSRSFALRILLPAPLFAALATFVAAPRLAHAQVNDADRAAARELYVQGVGLQEVGKFGEALDRFNRAQAVFSAPTHLLHIAECDAALGKLVESAETYRTLVRTPLPDGAPNAFVQAQKQGAAELTQVEPRLPSIRLIVHPENVQNLAVQVDGQPMSSALVGVQRPTDPGQHVIVVSAPGYLKMSQRIALQEKENRDINFTLQASNGIVYGTAPAGYPPQVQPAQPAPQYSPAPPPYGSAPPEYKAPDENRPASGGFMMGPSLGVVLPGGSTAGGDQFSNIASPGAGVGVEAGFRFVRRLYLGAVYQHGFLSAANAQAVALGSAAVTTTVGTNYFGLNFAYISHPEGVAFYGEIGGGFRTFSNTQTATDNSASASTTLAGGELSIGVGLHLKFGDWIRVIPKVSVSGGQFGTLSCNQTGSATCPTTGTITNTDTHTFVFLGVTGFIDFARKH